MKFDNERIILKIVEGQSWLELYAHIFLLFRKDRNKSKKKELQTVAKEGNFIFKEEL